MPWGPGRVTATSLQPLTKVTKDRASKCLDSHPHRCGLCWEKAGRMEKYLPAERTAQANTRRLVVFKDTSCSLLKFHGPLSRDNRFLGACKCLPWWDFVINGLGFV